MRLYFDKQNRGKEFYKDTWHTQAVKEIAIKLTVSFSGDNENNLDIYKISYS